MDFSVVEPESLGDAVAALQAQRRAVLYAGGVQLLADAKLGLADFSCLVSLKRVPGLRLHEPTPDGVEVGAGLCFRDLAASDAVGRRAPLLQRVGASIGNVRVRGRATLGGNLYLRDAKSDVLPVMLVHDADIHLAGAAGTRVAGAEAFAAARREPAGDVITKVVLRHGDWSFGSARRRHLVRPLMSAACAVQVLDGGLAACRIAVGGLSDRAVRVRAVEDALTGLEPADALRRCAPEELAGLLEEREIDDDAEVSSWYKHRLGAVMIAESVHEAMAQAARRGETP